MKKTVLGLSVAVLLAGAGVGSAQDATTPAEQIPANESATPSTTAQDSTTTQSDEGNTRIAAADVSAAAFKKLDADSDGRVSAIEAANDTAVAAGFTRADTDKDGYLSKDEFKKLSAQDQSSSRSSSEFSDSMSTTTPSATDPSMESSSRTPSTDPQTTVPPQ